MRVVIATVDEIYYEGEAYSLTAPGAEGEMTVLSHHEPLVTTLKAGRVLVRPAQSDVPQEFTIHGGILEVNSGGATIIL